MTFLLSACVLWISSCISFLSADSIIPVSAPLSSTVLLPCQFKRDLGQTPHVQWRIGSKVVFERRGKRFYQSEGYEGRVDIPENKLLKGNCSLVLKNIRATDAGIYKSYMVGKRKKMSTTNKWNFVQNIALRVDETLISDKETSDKSPSTTKTLIPDKETPEESPAGTKTLIPDKETPEESPAGTNAGIIYSVVACVSIVPLAIIAIGVVLYMRNINNPSNKTALKISMYDEHRVFMDS